MKYLKERFLLIPIWLILITGYSASVWQYQTNQNYQSATYDNPVTQSSVPVVHYGMKGASPQNNEGDQQEQEKHKAQMADHMAQVWMARYALIGVILGIVGTILLYKTYLYSRKAVAVTREIGEKQSCAYMTVGKARFGHNQSHAVCEITVENVGQSPCVEGIIKAKIKSENTLVPTFMETDEVRDFYSGEEIRKFGIVQTSHSITMRFSWFGGHHADLDTWFDLFMSDIGSDSRAIFELRWKDVFGKWHTSNFDAHKHYGKGINWNDLRIWSDELKINPEQKYQREK